ncbi:MAG: TlpA family protein disulfide reductase [Chloroflexi bacterium]|nr:TlpA family protein disulfide reductase [Chloroflexota bacterium]
MNSKAHARKSASLSKFPVYLFIAGIALVIVLGAIGWNSWQTSRTPEIAAQVNSAPIVALQVKPAENINPPPAAAPQDIGAQIGKVAPDFTLPTLGGGTFTLADKRGKPTVVFFMAYWCGSCIPEAIALGKLQQEYGDKVSIAAVNIDPSATWETIEQFKQAAGDPPLVWASDFDQKVTFAYAVRALDTTLILDREGRIAYRDEIPTQYKTLKGELEKLKP